MANRRPSIRCLNSVVTLVRNTWGKDSAGGRVVTSTTTSAAFPCQWDPGSSTTTVDEVGRWTTERSHVFRFWTDPGLKAQDLIRVEDVTGVHTCIVSLSSNPAGRSVFFEVPAVERI